MDCVRCKDPIDVDSNFCKKCGMQQDDNSTPEINNDYSPKIGKDILPKSNDKQDNQKGLMVILGIAFPILLGIIIGFTL